MTQAMCYNHRVLIAFAHLQQPVPQVYMRQLWTKHHHVQHLLTRLLSLLESTQILVEKQMMCLVCLHLHDLRRAATQQFPGVCQVDAV